MKFGYVVLWTVVWPIAPLFAFVNNFFELRTDTVKLTKHSRRPVPTRSDSIGPWLLVLTTLTWLGAIVNTALVYLFKPSQRIFTTSLDPSTDQAGVTLKDSKTDLSPLNISILTNRLEATIRKSELANHDSKGSTPENLYQSLFSILISALVPVLFSEHAYLFARFVLKRTIDRLMWINSEAFVTQGKAEWELKQSFLAQMDPTTSTPTMRLPNPPETECGKDSDGGVQQSAGETFWSRADLGMDEIGRLDKTE